MFETYLFRMMRLNRQYELNSDPDRFDVWDEIRKRKDFFEE
ncbi:MAG: hypothetical protein Q7J10_07345 [Methanosarcinaceae archaeon]|nr:hypothetical protein [Methanosarcinaceae archaeon]